MNEIPIFKFVLNSGLSDQYLPQKGTELASGWDVRSVENIRIYYGQYVKIPLGFRVFSPPGWWLELRPRSSSFVKKNLHALYGVIDEDYEGQCIFVAQYLPADSSMLLEIKEGEAIGQMLPVKRQEMIVEKVTDEEYKRLCEERNAARGTGGFGSTTKYWVDVFSLEEVPNFELDPQSPGNEELPPIATPEIMEALQNLYKSEPRLHNMQHSHSNRYLFEGEGIDSGFDLEASWIQTYSGRRFNPTKPNPNAIVLQDIAHALSMQCRFTGHCKHFYSVAQHSVLVSYICDSQDALWGLLHDASEAYLIDVPRPLKQSGQFQAYIDFEKKMQEAICKRFGLPLGEPPSVKKADTILLATEARELMSPLHPDWKQDVEPLPFLIEPWGPGEAKDMFIKRFFELKGQPSDFEYYLNYKAYL